MRRLIPILAAALAGSALTAAAITLPALAADRDERIRAWETCMREQGLGFDPEGITTIRIEDGRVTIDGEEVDPDRFGAAQRQCGTPFVLPPLDLEDRPELENLPGLELRPNLPELPDFETLPRFDERPESPTPRFEDLPRFDERPELPRLPDFERTPRFEPRPEQPVLPELQELRDRLERLENCLRGELEEA
jgi:hypothetical protein